MAAAISEELRSLLRELDLESLALTFATEDISVSHLRKLADDHDKFDDSMRELNIPYLSAVKLHSALVGEPDACAISPTAVQDSRAAIAALSKMAKAQSAAPPPQAMDMDDILAAALGRVASVSGPRPSEATKLKATSDGPKVNAALLAYQQQRGTDGVEGEGAGTKRNENTQIVLASGETKTKTKEFIPVYMSSR